MLSIKLITVLWKIVLNFFLISLLIWAFIRWFVVFQVFDYFLLLFSKNDYMFYSFLSALFSIYFFSQNEKIFPFFTLFCNIVIKYQDLTKNKEFPKNIKYYGNYLEHKYACKPRKNSAGEISHSTFAMIELFNKKRISFKSQLK